MRSLRSLTPGRSPRLGRTPTWLLAASILAFSPQTGRAQETIELLFRQPLPNSPGKVFTTTIVDFPPGVRSKPHRHGQAFVYAYVLEGSVRSQLEGEPVRTYRAGQFWSEAPGAHHLITANASSTQPARLLVTFIATADEALKVDDGHPTTPPR